MSEEAIAAFSPEELERVRVVIETATKVSRARNEEMFRCVNILSDMAMDHDKLDAAKALLEAAKRILSPTPKEPRA